MAIDRVQASRDENLKLQLERALFPRLQGIERRLIEELVRSLGTTGQIPDIAGMQTDALQPLLSTFYQEVSSVFSRRVSDQLPPEAAITDEERLGLDAALAALFLARSRTQADQIAGTSQADAEASQRVALADRDTREERGEVVTRQESAIVAGATFARRLSGRTTSVVMFETQAAAEIAKQAEVETLVGETLRAMTVVRKEWVSQGDNIVRPAHIAADSQRVLSEEAFRVGGERLMFPGDTSLGASPGNVINCRCSSVTDVEAIATVRS